MFQFRSPERTPTAADLCERFGFRTEEIDGEYGFIQVDERKGLYVTLVDERSRARVTPRLPAGDAVTGFFADPRVEPFGEGGEGGA